MRSVSGGVSPSLSAGMSPSLPDGVLQLAGILKNGICSNTVDPFHCRIVDQQGTVRNDGSRWFTPEEIMHMDYLCGNVEGIIPEFEAVLPQSQHMMRLLGLHREQIPPEKERVIL